MPRSEPNPGSGAVAGRLPAGRHKLSREFVVRSQRDRLLDAMAQQCAAGGYGSATVDAVIARARVSSKTCYELFESREELFLAAYDAILAQFLERVISAYEQPELDWPERVRAGLGALLSFLASEPAFARMCIVEVLAAGDRALERYNGAITALATLLDGGRALATNPDELPASTASDVIEGAAFLIRAEILAGRTRQLESLLGDILYAALVPYLGPDQALRQARPTPPPSSGKKTRSARSKQTGATSDASLPAAEEPSGARARHERWRENAKRARYEWMLGTMIDTFADRGYHQTSMNDIAARIGISRDTLRAHFGDKQDLFIVAHDWLLQRLANYVGPAYQQPGPWPQRISRALGALLSAIAYRPQGARVAIIEVLAAGPQAHQHHLAAIDTFSTYIDQGRNESPLGHNLPPTLARIVAGAAAARIHKHIAAGHTSELPNLHPQLLYLVLLPYLGHQQAQHEMQRPRAQ